ncbi:hypothetical protein [Dyadobacter helix]|nr:hypothetical protein [Dyadobacter sp. CECT 9275]
MKIFKKTFVVTALLLAVFSAGELAASPLRPKKECKNNECQTFKVGLYRIKDTYAVKLLLEKQQGEKVSVRLLDRSGKILHQEYVGSHLNQYGRKFNLEELGDGDYTLEISNNSEKIIRNIQLKTSKAMEVKMLGDNLSGFSTE